ncbi:lantibiotic dehydratase C-terminal domain-containing protein [Streptomyces coeruleofuscus]|uniref:Thiopeptide-type bacteriocin biosynthesis domain-containing protein n=1 Tax=Streptomyces coeruleofuscus TaxID=66879 RepID=A0ABN3I9U2_9ACTN
MRRGLAGDLEIASYEPEVVRYGGPRVHDAIERLFEAGSDTALQVVDRMWASRPGGDGGAFAVPGAPRPPGRVARPVGSPAAPQGPRRPSRAGRPREPGAHDGDRLLPVDISREERIYVVWKNVLRTEEADRHDHR